MPVQESCHGLGDFLRELLLLGFFFGVWFIVYHSRNGVNVGKLVAASQRACLWTVFFDSLHTILQLLELLCDVIRQANSLLILVD